MKQEVMILQAFLERKFGREKEKVVYLLMENHFVAKNDEWTGFS